MRVLLFLLTGWAGAILTGIGLYQLNPYLSAGCGLLAVSYVAFPGLKKTQGRVS